MERTDKFLDPEHMHIRSHRHIRDGVIDFVAGSLGGIALVYVGQPLDTIKVKMQTFPAMYRGMINCGIKTLKHDGIYRGLYAGTVPALATNVLENAVLFLGYGVCQKFVANVLDQEVKQLSTFSNAFAGFLASFFSSIAITPTELIKCKMQASYEVAKQMQAKGIKVDRVGPGKLFMQILRQDGITGIFRGIVPTLAREMPGYFFFFYGYEGSREFFRKEGQTKEDIGLMRTMVSGAVGGTVFWCLTYPIDVAKSRIQVNKNEAGLVQVLMNIARREGFGMLYAGLKPTVVRTIPATAALFVTYEYSKQFMHDFTDGIM